MECSMLESSSVAAWGQEWFQSQRVGGYLLMFSMILVLPWKSFHHCAHNFFLKWRAWETLQRWQGEAMSTLRNVTGIGAGIGLASTVCSTTQGKLIAGPLLSAVHIYRVVQETRATPINTLNPQRTAMIVADFIKSGKVSSPAELR